MAFNSIVGTVYDNTLSTSPDDQDIVLTFDGNDLIYADFVTVDYIIGGDGDADTLNTQGAFADFEIREHPGIPGGYIVRKIDTNIVNIIKDIENFQFTEGTVSLDDFLEGNPPDTQVFDLTVTLADFLEDEYTAVDGVSELIIIDYDQWNSNFSIQDFNGQEDMVFIDSDGQFTSAEDFVDANIIGENGTWAWDEDENVHLFSPALMEIAFINITGVNPDDSIYEADSDGWLTFDGNGGTIEPPPPPENTAPVANDDNSAFIIPSGAQIEINVSQLLANDTDADSDPLTITEIDDLGTNDGFAVLSDDGLTITFTAAAGYTGDASFSYTVSDGTDNDTAMVLGSVVENIVQVGLEDFTENSYTATLDAEVITISLADWTSNFSINDFNADQDVLIIDSDGSYNSAQQFIDANLVGEAGTWGYDGDGGAHLYNPDFLEIALVGIQNAGDNPALLEAEAQGWIQFV